jgi:hypothetical protein
MTLLITFGASLLFVGLKAFQQLNVVHSQYAAVFPTSLLMAACEVFVVANVARAGWHWPLVIAVGTGAGLGCCASMWIHKRTRKQ